MVISLPLKLIYSPRLFAQMKPHSFSSCQDLIQIKSNLTDHDGGGDSVLHLFAQRYQNANDFVKIPQAKFAWLSRKVVFPSQIVKSNLHHSQSYRLVQVHRTISRVRTLPKQTLELTKHTSALN